MEAQEISTLLNYLISPIAQVSFVMAIAEIAKNLGLDSRFVPILDVVLGIILGVLIFTIYQSMGIVEGTILGLAVGLSACGLFSGIKNVAGK